MSRPGTAERLDDLEWLIDGGVWPPDAVARVGWTIQAAEIAARRHGRARVHAVIQAHLRKTVAA